MKSYRSHKVVEAFKILDTREIREHGMSMVLIGVDDRVPVSLTYVTKHGPRVGGYYVRYSDGYESWSPAEAFEGGYTEVQEGHTS